MKLILWVKYLVKVPTNTWFTKIDIVIFLTEPSVKAWVPFVTTLKPEIRLVVGLRLSFTVLIYCYSNLNISFVSLKSFNPRDVRCHV